MRLPASGSFIVCDTDVASFTVKEDPIRAPRYLPHLAGRRVVLPFELPLVTHNAGHYRFVPDLRVFTEPD